MTLESTHRSRAALSALLTWTLFTPKGAANGRFPNASHVVVGPGASSEVIALRTTFGLLISRDAGARFNWLCEDAMYFPAVVGPQIDPAVEIMSDGSIHFAFEYGIHSAVTDCRIDPHPEVNNQFIADLAATPSGEQIFAIQANAGGSNRVLRADRSSGRYEPLGRGVQHMLFTTVEVAPSDARWVYAAGRDEVTRAPRLYRSEDGGATLNLQNPTLGLAEDLWISGIDPSHPEVLYLRASIGLGTWLFKSRDGGASVAHVATTRDAMLGFAISDDGRRVWIGSLADGLLRSDDGGETFAAVNPAEVLCLRHHAGVLWVCTNWLRTGYALGRSDDGGRSVRGVLRFDDVAGPYECPMPSEGQAYCTDRWPSQRDMIASASVPADSGPSDAPREDTASFDAVAPDAVLRADASPRDLGVADAPRRGPAGLSGGGLCATGPRSAKSPKGVLWAVAFACASARRARRSFRP